MTKEGLEKYLADFTRNRDVFKDLQLDDPAGQSIETFRRIRDEVKERVVNLIKRLN